MSGLFFETAAELVRAHPNRTDVACFIGYVARRAGVTLPPSVLAQLRAAGWIDGPWRRDPGEVEALEQLPVAVESWDGFNALFAWERRAVRAGQPAQCATYLGAAVRSFFATGGRRAVIVRVGDPWPYLEPDTQHADRRTERVQRLLPEFEEAGASFAPTEPREWQGLHHLYALEEASLLCLPDLPDLFADAPEPPPAAFDPPPAPEGFVECSADEPALPVDLGLRLVGAPRCDTGYEAWGQAVRLVREFLARHRREVIFIGALPLPHPEALRGDEGSSRHAEADLLAFLRRVRVLEAGGRSDAGDSTAASAFLQLAYPWLRTRHSGDLPQGLEPPDGLLAGLLARNALVRGTFRSVAGSLLPDVVEPVPMPASGLGPDSPAERLGERLCLIAPEPGGIALQSDVTTSPDLAWRPGGVSRLMAAVLRAARRFGDFHLFEANGPALWTNVRRSMEALLTGFWQAGGLGGASPSEAFTVRCDRSTMSQNDIDAGRLIAEVSVLPVAAVERITVVLNLDAGGPAQASIREVA